jgi:hypothetical protein
MTVTVKTFEVTVANERSALAFDLRGAVVDFIRRRISEGMARAEDAEIDRTTAMRRFALTYAAAAKGYRQVRTVPGSLLNWAGYVEYNKGREGFPQAVPSTVGTFDKDVVTVLPGNLMLIKMGGVTFAGTLESGKPDDLFEVRISPAARGYVATFVCGRVDGDDPLTIPQPVEPEGVDA